MKILALDYGDKTVGVAVTDDLLLTTQPVETIVRERENVLRSTLRRIEEIVAEKSVTDIVLGWPLLVSGEESLRTAKTEEFRRALEKRVSVPIHLQDERFTTVEAAEILAASGVRKADEKKYIDQVAATLILDDYLAILRKDGKL